MKTFSKALLVLALGLGLITTRAQMGGSPSGPNLGGELAKIFGENSSFSAQLDMDTTDAAGKTLTLPGKISGLDGKSRFEIDMTKVMGSHMTPEASAHMKAMGMNMDTMVMISRPDLKLAYVVYPGMQSYTEHALQDPQAVRPESDFTVETTELGKETIDDHPCIKNKVIVTDKEGAKHEVLVWNATDLKKFPLKIETKQNESTTTLHFKQVKLEKPDAGLFNPPADFKKYDSMGTMMQQEMMRRMQQGMTMPPQQK